MKFQGMIENRKYRVYVHYDDGHEQVLIDRDRCGFRWGCKGRDVENTALSILAEIVPLSVARHHCKAFAEHYVSRYPSSWEARSRDICKWLIQRISIVGDDALADADLVQMYPVLAEARRVIGTL